MQYLTPQEQERLAYAEGYTETAGVLARLDDAHHALGDEVAMQAQLDDANDTIDDLKRSIDLLGRQVIDAMAERENAKDHAKIYRSALMAIEAEVPAHIRQFIREVLE
jgi:predicted  nucleic acid-binding Zn-ribbon protein